MAKLNLRLPSQAPVNLPNELFTVINDLYTQLNAAVNQFNRLDGVLQSPNGHYWRVTVSNTGTVTTTDLGTVLPA